jgi:hypothetical protein
MESTGNCFAISVDGGLRNESSSTGVTGVAYGKSR